MAVNLSSLHAGRALPLRNIFDTYFCYRQSKPQGVMRLEGLGKLKEFNLMGFRARDLLACCIVPQPPSLPRAPRVIHSGAMMKETCHTLKVESYVLSLRLTPFT
jgi:hypothetical protein